jgi:hypothetical protein
MVELQKKYIPYIIYAIVALIFIFSGIFILLIQQNSKCNYNPLVYSATNMLKNNMSMDCKCNVIDLKTGNGFDFSFDSKGIHEEKKFNPVLPINLTLIP